MSKKPRFVSFFLALVMVVSSIPVAPAYAQNEDTISEITNPFRSDVSFTAGDSTVTSDSFRIPSMVTLADGTIVAAADIRWNTTYDGGGLDTLVARSTDGGKTWSYNAANYLGDNDNVYNGGMSTTFIDPNLLVAADGQTVYMLVDLYAYGVALNGDGSHIQPVADTGFDANGNLKLSNDSHYSYNYYLKNGKIYDSSNNVVEGYEIDAYFNITYTTQNGEIKKSNLFFADSPFKVARTQYLYLTKSTDGGATWSEPNLLDVRAKAKVATAENALLVSPGNSITTSGGIMVYPVYSYKTDGTQHVALIYSTDGVNWMRSSDYTALNWSSEGAIVELENGNIRVFVRNKTKHLCYVDFDVRTMTWIGHTDTGVPTNSNTQLSAITYSKTSNGDQVVLISCPTGPNGTGSDNNDGSMRTNGKIHIFTVNATDEMTLKNTINVFDKMATSQLSGSNYTEEKGFFAYSALTELSDGSIALLYENNQFGWGAGEGKYYTMDIKGYLPSALGLTLDEPQTVIMGANGNPIDSIAMSQYEKSELTAKAPFNSSDVAYQWQIEYEDGKWVDIYGEDSKTVKLSFGMVATLLGNDGQVDIRCETTAGAQVAYSKPITVTIEMYQPVDPDIVVSGSFTSSSGNPVTVTVKGDLPDGASVVLGETDATGVDVKPNETVVAALDISIKNADGSEWQPESGETVRVTLDASQIGLKNGDEFVVYHLHNGEIRVIGSYAVVNDTVSFEVDGFSKFVFARTEDEAVVETLDFSENIGKHAHFAWNDSIVNIEVSDEEPDENFAETAKIYSISDFSTDFILKIDGYKVVTQYGTVSVDSQTSGSLLNSILDILLGKNQDSLEEETIEIRSLWYQVSVVDGTAPEDFADGCWILQNYLTEADAYSVDTLVLFDAPEAPEEPEVPENPSVGVTVNGQDVTEITVSTAQKVTLTATPNTEGNDVAFRWQLLIPQANMWVDISGQTDAKCTVNYGMVANRLDADGKAYIRCVTTVDGREIVSEPIAVNVASAASYSMRSITHSTSPSSAYAAVPLANETGNTGVTKHTVTVYYYVGDSTVMHREVYTMEFGVNEEAKTTSFPVPEREGYTAYYFGTNANTGKGNGTEYTEAEYTLENFKPTSNMSLYVRYYPNEDTKYTVEHYVQNIYDDGWTLIKTEVREGTTDTDIPAFDQNYGNSTLALNWESEGFYATPYKRDTIAASGNTVVKVYYERYMYLLMFDLGEGGMGVDPIYARVGVEYEVDNEPTRRGYVFDGWELENGTTVPKDSKPYVFEIPAKDTIVKAIWTVSDTTYTVVYWKENADPNKDANGEIVRDSNGDPVYSYSYWAHAEVESNTGAVVSGTGNITSATNVTQDEAQYFTFNEVATDRDVVVKGNGSTVVNVYYLRNYYEIYFYGHGQNNSNRPTACTVTTHTHGDGTCETYPICAQKEHEHNESCTRLGLTCGTTLHTHTNACCTKEVHGTHTSACCTKTIHANHTTSCYDNVNTNQNVSSGDRQNAPANPVDGQVYRRSYNYNRIIYINGTWYGYSAYANSGTIVQPNNNCPGIHNHGDGNCTCTQAIHTHGDGTCSCNQTEHKVHTDSCYAWECGTSVSHVHTSACYSACIKPTHTHGSSCTNGSSSNRTRYLLKIIRAKYDADISREWPVADNSIPGLSGFAYWSGNGTDQSSRVVTMNGDWAKGVGQNAIKVNANYNTTEYHLNYWFEDFDQTDKTIISGKRVLHDGKYYVLSEKYTQDAYYSSGLNGWGYKTITGMTRAENGDASMSDRTANLYYNRNRWNLYFESDGTNVYTQNDIPFEKPLSYYLDADGNYITDIIPTTNPVDKPASGYYFEGWYTTGECFPGTKVDFTKLTMPNNDLTLFANWAPKTHTIEFYFDNTLTTRLDDALFPTQLILHNEYGADPGLPGHPMDFEAVVWFYKDANGEEKAFNFSMPVTEDMNLYPKWRTNVYINYEVRYKVYDRVSNVYTDIEIADRLYGEELYGELVTLNPKGTEEFYDAYKQIGNGYFPMSGSHSISMGEETCSGTPPYNFCTWDEQTSTHIFTFYYVNGPTIPYTVEYHEVDSDGNFVKKLLGDKYVPDNYYAKVVENAAIIPGYMPDEAQKTLYVVYESENKIIFNYTIDEEASFYRVSHWVKKYGSDEYVLLQVPDNFASRVGDIISNYPALEIPGITYTHTEIDPSNNTVGKTIDGKPGLKVDLYYEEESVTINYIVEGPSNCGTLTRDAETVGAYYGTVVGSQANPSSNAYKFVGWYSDAACNSPVTYDNTNNKFVPSKVDGIHVAANYYAKFEYNLTSLTIDKAFPSGANYSMDENQSFLFDVVELDENDNAVSNGVDLTVAIHGDGEVTIDGLTVGHRYKITEKTDWSWRYTPSSSRSITVTLTADAVENTVTFTNNRSNKYWLSGDSRCENQFTVTKRKEAN